MARKLTTLEKVKLLQYSPFLDVVEIDALEAAKHITENPTGNDKLDSLANSFLINGSVNNKLSFAKTWLTYLDFEIEVSEKQGDGLQLGETITLIISESVGKKSNLRKVTERVLEKQAESVTVQ